MSSITVRQALLSDLDDLAPLLDLHRQFQGQVGDLPGAREFLLARLQHSESVVFIAQQAGTARGFAQLFPSFSSFALARVFVLNDLFVHESGRRQGVGSRLLAAVQAYCWALGAVRITLNVARENGHAQALYQANGWSQDAQYFMFHRFPEPQSRPTA